MKNVFAVLVIYNKSIAQSPSYNCISKRNDISLIVCDNSVSDFGNEKAVRADGNTYISMGGNVGLPKAYNAAIDSIAANDGTLILFDDDTFIPDAYFEELDNRLNDTSWDILLPYVTYDGGIMSPCTLKKYSIHEVSEPSKLDIRYAAGINSGMVIRLQLFKNYRYDERAFLDFVDFSFVRHFRSEGKCFGVLKTELKQNFSKVTNDKSAARKRFSIMKRDISLFYSVSIPARLYGFYVLLKRAVRNALTYGDVRALFW